MGICKQDVEGLKQERNTDIAKLCIGHHGIEGIRNGSPLRPSLFDALGMTRKAVVKLYGSSFARGEPLPRGHTAVLKDKAARRW